MKKKKNVGQVIFTVLMMAAGACLGVIVALNMREAAETGSDFLRTQLLLVAVIVIAMYLQIVIHEAGHLVFGILSGYKFCSFRVGNMMLIKKNGKYKLRNFSIAGTGGQCLMGPPDFVDGKIPVVLYNLGGCIMNLLAVVLFAIIAILAKENQLIFLFAMSMVVIGLVFALSNGIPLRVGVLDNDGKNALSIGKKSAALRAFWTQLKVMEEIANEKRLKDLPEAYFSLPEEHEMNNPLVLTVAVFRADWLMDQGRMEEAYEYIKELLEKYADVMGLNKSILIGQRIYCELVVKHNTSEAIYLHNKEFENFAKAMRMTPSIIRTEYAYALLAEKDEEKAQKLLELFEKVAKRYPYEKEIEGERELIARVRC